MKKLIETIALSSVLLLSGCSTSNTVSQSHKKVASTPTAAYISKRLHKRIDNMPSNEVMTGTMHEKNIMVDKSKNLDATTVLDTKFKTRKDSKLQYMEVSFESNGRKQTMYSWKDKNRVYRRIAPQSKWRSEKTNSSAIQAGNSLSKDQLSNSLQKQADAHSKVTRKGNDYVLSYSSKGSNDALTKKIKRYYHSVLDKNVISRLSETIPNYADGTYDATDFSYQWVIDSKTYKPKQAKTKFYLSYKSSKSANSYLSLQFNSTVNYDQDGSNFKVPDSVKNSAE